MHYVVYCDESRHCAKPDDTHMAIGGLWVPLDERDRISREIRTVAKQNGLGSEMKWSKVSSRYLDGYMRVIDVFFSNDINYRAILVEHGPIDISFHDGDRELGFYKFYFRMLEKWLLEENQYTILLDFQKNRGADRFSDLRKILTRAVPYASINELTVIDSNETPLAQLNDLLTGAVSAAWCRSHEKTDSAKSRLISHIATRLNWLSLRQSSASPAWSKFNIFAMDLASRG